MIKLLAAISGALMTLIVGIGVGGAMNARPVDAASAYAATSTAWVTSTAVVAPTTDRHTAQVTATSTTHATATATSTATSTAHVAVTRLNTVTPTPRTAESDQPLERSYSNCAEARADGAAPLHRGEPGYSRKLDRDGDGTACEP